MKLVIKPAGILLLCISLGVLVFLAVRNRGLEGTTGAAPPPAGKPAAVAGAAPATGSTSATPLPPVDWKKARHILEPDIASQNWRMLLTSGGAEAEQNVVEASVKGHPFARRVTIKKTGPNPWDIQIAHPLSTTFKKGQRLRLTYFARSPESCPITAVVEQAQKPYEKLAYREAQLTPEWVQYNEEWEQNQDTPSDWAHIDFQVGKKPGKVEITGVVIEAVDAG